MATAEERLAVLETKMDGLHADIAEMKAALANLNKIASQGKGVLQTVLMFGGVLGWIASPIIALYATFHH